MFGGPFYCRWDSKTETSLTRNKGYFRDCVSLYYLQFANSFYYGRLLIVSLVLKKRLSEPFRTSVHHLFIKLRTNGKPSEAYTLLTILVTFTRSLSLPKIFDTPSLRCRSLRLGRNCTDVVKTVVLTSDCGCVSVKRKLD